MSHSQHSVLLKDGAGATCKSPHLRGRCPAGQEGGVNWLRNIESHLCILLPRTRLRSRERFRPVVCPFSFPILSLSHEGSAGARHRATVSDCLAAAGKTRRRAPLNGVLHPRTRQHCPRDPLLSGLGTRLRALQRTSGAKLSVSAAVPGGLAPLADASGGTSRLIPASGTGPASPWRPRV